MSCSTGPRADRRWLTVRQPASRARSPRALLRVLLPRLLTTLLPVWLLLGSAGAVWAAVPTGSLEHGPFEIIAKARKVSTGTFPNQGGNPFAAREVSDFEVRWRGKSVAGAGGNTRFWRVLRLAGTPRPALLLVTSGFTLATEDETGQLQVTPLKTESRSLAEAQWLDSHAGQPGPSFTYGIEAIRSLEADTLLAGGRWLRLGSRAVIDVSRLTVFAVSPWVPTRPGVPITSLSREGDDAHAFSPGRSQFVLAASGYDYASPDGRRAHGLLAVEIADGTAYELRVDRRRFRFADAQDMDAAWIDHHFEWQRASDGRERLAPRARFQPWPWRARLRQIRAGELQINVPRIDPAILPVVRRLVTDMPGSEATVPASSAAGPGLNLVIGGCRLSARVFGTDSPDPDDLRLNIWSDSANGAPKAEVCEQAIRTLAAAIDRELATGRHDGLLKLD